MKGEQNEGRKGEDWEDDFAGWWEKEMEKKREGSEDGDD